MAKVKTIKQYKQIQDGYTTIEIPILDEESKTILEMNFNQYINVLSDILIRYSSKNDTTNFKLGQVWQ